MIDIDPGELAKLRWHGGYAQASAVLKALPAAVEADAATGPAPWRPSWLAWCRGAPGRARSRRAPAADRRQPQHLRRGPSASWAWSPGKVFAPTSSGWAIEAFSLLRPRARGRPHLLRRVVGAMGLGLPQAPGASFGTGPPGDLRRGRRRADAEPAGTGHPGLLRAWRASLLFVLNNDGYGSIQASQVRHFRRRGRGEQGLGRRSSSTTARSPRRSACVICGSTAAAGPGRPVADPGRRRCAGVRRPDDRRHGGRAVLGEDRDLAGRQAVVDAALRHPVVGAS